MPYSSEQHRFHSRVGMDPVDKYKKYEFPCRHGITDENLISQELKLILRLLDTQDDFEDGINILLMKINWDYLLKLIVRHRVVPQIFKQIKNLPGVPAKFITDLNRLNYNTKMQNLNIMGEIIRITKVLTQNNIPYLIVKGIPLAQFVYKDYTLRQAKDIDLLIDIVNLDQAQNLIINLGYTCTAPKYNLTGFKRSYYLTHCHDIALFNQHRSVEVELHFKLNYWGLPFFKLAEIPRKTINLNCHQIYIPDDEYHLLYLMLHAAIHAYSRIRWLHDIVLFLETTAININKVFALAEKLHMEHIVIQACFLIINLYPKSKIDFNLITEPESEVNFLSAVALNNKQGLDLARIAMKFIIAEYELSNNNSAWNKMFILYRFYLVKLAVKHQKFQVIFADLIKIDKIFPYVTMPKYMSFGYYILYPIMIIKYLIFRRF